MFDTDVDIIVLLSSPNSLDDDEAPPTPPSAYSHLPQLDPGTATIAVPKERVQSLFKSIKKAGEQAMQLRPVLTSIPPAKVRGTAPWSLRDNADEC